MNRKKIAVLMGGKSVEHDVSVNSGSQVMAHLDRERFDPLPVTIQKNGDWCFPGELPFSMPDAVPYLSQAGLDCVFICLHGPFGEDGRIQGLFDLLEIPYTGSGCISSGIAIDKVRSKALVQAMGVSVADQVLFTLDKWQVDKVSCMTQIQQELGYPCVVKSPCQGSSLGMFIAQSPDELEHDLPPLFDLDSEVLVERYLSGVEVSCGVLDVWSEPGPRALSVTEIRPLLSPYFDYKAKYTPGATDEITPAHIPEAVRVAVQKMAVSVHCAIGCTGMSRSDMILVDNRPIWLEVNTIPGLTKTSLLPQEAAADGIAFAELVTAIIEDAMDRRCNRSRSSRQSKQKAGKTDNAH